MEVDTDDSLDSFPDAKPDFSGPPIILPQFCSYIESGTFISYNNQVGQKHYGRITSTSFTHTSGTICVNEFIEFNAHRERLNTISAPAPLNNAYINVDKLVHTNAFVDFPFSSITRLIFVFRKEEIVEGVYPCKGMELCFVLRNRYVGNRYKRIPPHECLPFPSMYVISRISMRYSKRIYDALYDVRKTVTHMMCWNGKNLGVSFISGSNRISFPIESWIFVRNYVSGQHITIQGPFPKSRKHLQVRRFLDVNAVRMKIKEEII